MKCQRCKEREANVQIVQQGQGKKPQTFLLCDVCARELGISIPTFPASVKLNNPFAVTGNAFQTTFGLGTEESVRRRVSRCDQCGLTFDEFRKTGFLGCPNCYSVFGSQMDPVFCRTQMGKKHLGRNIGTKMKVSGRKKEDDIEKSSIEERFGMNVSFEKPEDADILQSEKMIPPNGKESAGKKPTKKAIVPVDEVANLIESKELNVLEKQHREVLIQEKRSELEKAVSEEKYLLAAKLRDEIIELKKTGE